MNMSLFASTVMTPKVVVCQWPKCSDRDQLKQFRRTPNRWRCVANDSVLRDLERRFVVPVNRKKLMVYKYRWLVKVPVKFGYSAKSKNKQCDVASADILIVSL